MTTIHYINPDGTFGEHRFNLAVGTVNVADNLLLLGSGFAEGQAVKFFASAGAVLPGGINADTFYYVGPEEPASSGFFTLLDGPHGAEVNITTTGSGQIIVFLTHLLAEGDGSAEDPFIVSFKTGGKHPLFLHVVYTKDTEDSMTLNFKVDNQIAGNDFTPYVLLATTELVPLKAEVSIVGDDDAPIRMRFPIDSIYGKILAASDSVLRVLITVEGTDGGGEMMLGLAGDTPNSQTPHALFRG